ncbi:MAG: ThuA domain-containing protein [Gemmatales bacterium]|nr:ThuA domain-containing protein [Gemmatales bacterium]MDW7994935.1 ThuA domain-containing protein [Gemmatales bacterium]
MLTRRDWLALAASGLVSVSDFSLLQAQEKPKQKKRLLMFTKSSGFEHSVIRRPKPDQLSHAENIVTKLGEQYGFEVVCTKDGRVFIPEEIAKYDAFFFYTTGDLTQPGTDKYPPMSPAGKKALLEAIQQGKGFIGSHCAADTFHSPGRRDENQPPEQRDPYIVMLGGEFIVHGAQQKARMQVVSRPFPALKNLEDFVLYEEWYALKNFAPDLHVILVQDTTGMQGAMYQRPPFPATWARYHGQGRVFYTSMGHREDVWTNGIFQKLLVSGILWALRELDGEIKPNLHQVTPKASVLRT